MSLKGIQVVRTFVKNSLHYDAQYLNESLVDSVRDKKTNRSHISTAPPLNSIVATCFKIVPPVGDWTQHYPRINARLTYHPNHSRIIRVAVDRANLYGLYNCCRICGQEQYERGQANPRGFPSSYPSPRCRSWAMVEAKQCPRGGHRDFSW